MKFQSDELKIERYEQKSMIISIMSSETENSDSDKFK